MPQHRTNNGTSIAADFLTRCFAPGESIALLLRRENPAGILQRIVPFERALASRYLGWMAHENSIGANIYVAANPLRSGSRKRTKECIAAVRHLYLDLDTDGEAHLASLRASDAVPIPNAIVSTSLGKYQVLWRVDAVTSRPALNAPSSAKQMRWARPSLQNSCPTLCPLGPPAPFAARQCQVLGGSRTSRSVDPASEAHGSRNRQETSNRAYEQCIILESQQ